MWAGPLRHDRSALAPPAFLLPLTAGVVVALLVFGFLAGSPTQWARPSAGSPPGGPLSGLHLDAAQCALIVSNASLTLGIVHLYQGNGNTSGPGSGLIDQSPPGPSAYPSESLATANVENGWIAVCTSTSFYPLEHEWGSQNASWSGLDQNLSGTYEYVFTVEWQAPPASCPASPAGQGAPCMGTAQWLVNVASGEVSGPTGSFWAPQPAD